MSPGLNIFFLTDCSDAWSLGKALCVQKAALEHTKAAASDANV